MIKRTLKNHRTSKDEPVTHDQNQLQAVMQQRTRLPKKEEQNAIGEIFDLRNLFRFSGLASVKVHAVVDQNDSGNKRRIVIGKFLVNLTQPHAL